MERQRGDLPFLHLLLYQRRQMLYRRVNSIYHRRPQQHHILRLNLLLQLVQRYRVEVPLIHNVVKQFR